MKQLFSLLILLMNIQCSSQVLRCDTITKKNIYYVGFEIKSKKTYPVKMIGVFENYDLTNFNKKDVGSFISSFYSKGIYSPYLIKGYKKMLSECMDSSQTNSFENKNNSFISDVTQRFESISPTDEITLNTGEKVVLKVFNISGVFFRVDKTNQGIFTNSMEWDINDISEINEVYVPFDNLHISDYIKK
ncbi:hypothetical protein N0B16_05605 [Chryseobacterium sp. GMJ5]|uniref:Lipoprotein n=1 Tax=Chryseobacterium gilvum TaxID=2976534 RepID=A0ABT2VY98_9FLAO|nr:hypothetical protein [Chryseobacterium gilvum]MCU7613907.1 hypothetical protein [Chryseobacterium gilvum]